jgi:hypothetical protein
LINPTPYQFESFKLSYLLSISHTCESFFRYGHDNYGIQSIHDEILIFYTNSALNSLKNNKIWCVDGTFQVVPKPWYQLYTISFLKNNCVFPSVFIILKNKKYETYCNALKILCENNVGLCPKVIKSDFEIASINALKLIWPDAKISACQFHMAQALMRKLKEFNIFYDYKSNPIIKKFVKSLIALSSYDIDQILHSFECLKQHHEFPSVLLQFYQYFFENYITFNLCGRVPVSCGMLQIYLIKTFLVQTDSRFFDRFIKRFFATF